jgi:hypothetical protein
MLAAQVLKHREPHDTTRLPRRTSNAFDEFFFFEFVQLKAVQYCNM